MRPLDLVVLRAGSDLPREGAARATVTVTPDRFTNLKVVTARISGRDPASVTFAARRVGERAWQRLGADDGAPYRVYLDPTRYRKGSRLSLVAVVRSSDGSVSTSPVLTVRPR
jgi:hypothetical protein